MGIFFRFLFLLFLIHLIYRLLSSLWRKPAQQVKSPPAASAPPLDKSQIIEAHFTELPTEKDSQDKSTK